MTAYIAGSVADRPRVRHLPENRVTDDESVFSTSACGERIRSVNEYAEARASYIAAGHRKSTAKPIDYEALPLCKLCAREASKA